MSTSQPRRRTTSYSHQEQHPSQPRRRRRRTTPYEKILIIIITLILINVAYSAFRYITAKHVAGYEVRTGSLENNVVYTGIALRQETVVGSDYPGYINYYAREGDRLGAGKLAYTIDESGEVAQAVSNRAADDSAFTSEDYADIQNDITSYLSGYQNASFSSVYEFKDKLDSEIQKMSSSAILSDIEKLSEDDSIYLCNTTDTGYIVYSTDGYEDLTFDKVTASDFDQTNYQKTDLENNARVASGDPAYKLETAEDWDIVIQLKDADAEKELTDLGVVTVKFLANQEESYATVADTKTDSDGNIYADLHLTNSMMAFCTERFIQIEVITDNTTGLKIPVSALVDDDFYIVPADYVTEGTGGVEQVLRQTVTDAGDQTTQTVTVTVYGTDEDGNYYVDQTSLRNGDVLVKLNSTSTYTVGETAKLQGVYNINEGYADFRQVSVVRQNDEYAIVKPDSVYGLREYDYIVLDAKNMSPNEFIYD